MRDTLANLLFAFDALLLELGYARCLALCVALVLCRQLRQLLLRGRTHRGICTCALTGALRSATATHTRTRACSMGYDDAALAHPPFT